MLETSLEQLEDRTDLRTHALVRPHDPRQRAVEVGTGVEAGHAELLQGPLQAFGEGRRKTVGSRLDPPEVLEEVTLGAVTQECFVLVFGFASEQGDHVGEDRQHLLLPLQLVIVVEALTARIGARSGERLDVGRVEVVAEEELADRPEPVRAMLVVDVTVDGQVGEGQSRRRRSGLVGAVGGFDHEQAGSGLHLIVAVHVDLANGAGELGADRGLHLHGLDHGQPVAGFDGFTFGYVDRYHDSGRRGPNGAALVVLDAVRLAVDVDEVRDAVDGRHHSVPPAGDGEDGAGTTEVFTMGLDHVAVDQHAVVARGEAAHLDVDGLAAMTQIDGAFEAWLDGGPSTKRQRTKRGGLHGPFGAGGIDGGGHDRHLGVVGLGDGHLIDPADVDVARDQLGVAQQAVHEGLVGGAVAHDDPCLFQGAAEPGDRLVTVVSEGDDLGDHRVELRRDLVTLLHAGVDPQTRPGGEAEQLDTSRRRGEVAFGILGVDAGLDGMADRGRGLTQQSTAESNMNLKLHQVEPGCHLGDGVFDLEARVDLHEREPTRARFEEELDGSGIPVASGLTEPDRSLAHELRLILVERGRRSLLDDLLVAALHAAVADAHGPHGAVVVADDLHFDVLGPDHQLFDEHRAVAEGTACFGTSGLEGRRELVGVLHPPDAPASTTRSGLDQHGISDSLGMFARLVDGFDGTAAPLRDRHR